MDYGEVVMKLSDPLLHGMNSNVSTVGSSMGGGEERIPSGKGIEGRPPALPVSC